MEYLINLVGNYSIGWGITIIAALVFLVLCYRKVESYFSDKAIHEKEKNEQFKKVMDQVNMYPSWHQQSIEIQQQFNKSIAELKEGMDAGYIILTEAQINAKMAVYLIALVLLSWLASMVGYDKVIQAITQCKKYKEE